MVAGAATDHDSLAVMSPGATVLEPVILSASRATDIPSFYADWFMNRLRAGSFTWVNPFRPSQVVQVLSRRVRAIVFWSKHPERLLPHLDELDERGLHFYIHYTLNDYESEGLEPHLPPLAERKELFFRLADRLGPDRVIWRMDPLVRTDRLDVSRLLDKAEPLMAQLVGHTRKLVFSFVDIDGYSAVQRHLARSGQHAREFTRAEMLEFARGLADLNRRYGMELATCAEPVDLSTFGMDHNRCVDGELLARLWPQDEDLMAYLAHPRAQKDRGQRPACGCVASKDIGRYQTCPHLCAYCYANHSPGAVQRHAAAHRPDGERI